MSENNIKQLPKDEPDREKVLKNWLNKGKNKIVYEEKGNVFTVWVSSDLIKTFQKSKKFIANRKVKNQFILVAESQDRQFMKALTEVVG